VAGNGKRSTAEKEISEDSGAHAGCGVIIVARFGWDRGANAGRFDREGDNGAEVEWMMAGVVPPRRAGRKAIRISVSMGTKCSTTSDTTRCRCYHLCWRGCWKAQKAA